MSVAAAKTKAQKIIDENSVGKCLFCHSLFHGLFFFFFFFFMNGGGSVLTLEFPQLSSQSLTALTAERASLFLPN